MYSICVLLNMCIRDKTNKKQTHTIKNIFFQFALKIINKIKTFILHSLKLAAVCMLPLTAATRKLEQSSTVQRYQNSGIESIHSGASKMF